MSNFVQKLVTISATFFIYFPASLGFAASTSTNWQEEEIKQNTIEQPEVVTINTNTFQTANENIAEDPLNFLSIGNNAIVVDYESSKATLFERDFSTWPYYLLSYNAGTDPEADFLMSMARVCGVIFIIGLTILLVRFFKLRKLRADLLH